MNNYISLVLSRITGKTAKKQIEAELQAHIDDRTQYYINAGYDADTAAQKAEEHMGNTAELVGDQLNSMKKSKVNSILAVLFVLLNLGILFVYTMFTLSYVMDECFRHNGIILFYSSVFLAFVILELYVAVKIKNRFLAVSSGVLFMLHGLYNLGYTPVVFCFYEFVAGKSKDLAKLLNTYNFRCGGIIAYALCVLFIAGCFYLASYACRHIEKFQMLIYGKNYYKNEKKFKLILTTVLLFVVFVTFFSLYSGYKDESFVNQTASLEGFYFIDSDVELDLKQITDYEDKQIIYQYDLFSSDSVVPECISYEEQHSWDDADYDEYYPIQNFYIQNYCKKYKDLNRAVSYRTEKITAEFHTDKKYVMIVPMYKKEIVADDESTYYPDFANAQWVAVAENTTVKSKEKEFNHKGMQLITFVEYEFQIIPY